MGDPQSSILIPPHDRHHAHFKALKRLVKEHDLRLREAETHVQHELTDVPEEVLNEGSNDAFITYGDDLVQEIEATVADICTEVETGREKLQGDIRSVTEDIQESMTRFLSIVVEILNIDASIHEANEREKQHQLNKSQKALETDEAFRSLFAKRENLVNQQKQCLEKLKLLDSNKVILKRKQLCCLSEEKKALETQLKCRWQRTTQELLHVPHIDRDTADLIQLLTNGVRTHGVDTENQEPLDVEQPMLNEKTGNHSEDPTTPSDVRHKNGPRINQNKKKPTSISPVSTSEILKRRGSVAVAADTYDKRLQRNIPQLFTKRNAIYPHFNHTENALSEDIHSLVMDTVAFRKRDLCFTQKMTRFLSHPTTLQGNSKESAFFSWITMPVSSESTSVEKNVQRILAQTLLEDSGTMQEERTYPLAKECDFQKLVSRLDLCSPGHHDPPQHSCNSASSTDDVEETLPASIPPVQRPTSHRRPPPHQVF